MTSLMGSLIASDDLSDGLAEELSDDRGPL